ncbi:octopamine receptor beta-2R-like [Anoplophora glabripennis]|uniref:octopamine receptor beta-2R-like n=1 Tax=Anoplophora glabripennis TaxID=217634 RepID=UPI0008744314|nr:octopamine receptor beta-2R-like [Anoplophora glabripennis]
MEEYFLNATDDAFNATLNLDNSTGDVLHENIVHLCISLLLVCCLLAMCVNCVVIVSVYWIRSPMTPNLKISLSLAIADAVSSSMTGLMLFLDEIQISEHLGVIPCLIELIRLSGIVITVLHLLALSLNHYIGIMKPLHYNSIVTKRKVSTVIALLWICPVVLLVILCTIESKGALFENIQNNTSSGQIFTTFLARMSYGTLFFCPIVLMVFCYTHILITVRNQQQKWKNLSRLGSSRNKGRNVNGRSSSQKANREQIRLQGNIKAIKTTLLILGSCFIGWMPALLFFILMCRNDCPINGETLNTLNQEYKYEVMTLRLIDNMLVIMKMLANPIIYTIRMKEIKDSTHRMYLALAGIFCPARRNNNAYSIAYQSSRKQNSVVTSQIRLNSFRNNPTDSHVI